jgi:hypothetical protein
MASAMLKVVKKWYSDIADLRQKHKLIIVMRDNAGENKSQEIIDFFESVKERISTTPWRRMYGVMRDVSRFRAFGCRAWVYLDKERRENGHAQLRQSISDSSPIQAHIASLFRRRTN